MHTWRVYRTFITAEWRWLILRNYRVDPDALAAYVPRGTELDLWQGETYVSLVGFMFLNTRVLGVPIPFHRNFEEINLRFYVKRVVDGETRRGVVFIKELVPKHVIAWVARRLYNENYSAAPMSHRIDNASGEFAYAWQSDGERFELSASTRGGPQSLSPGSHEEFIAEHFWGYVRQRDGGTVEYHVEHPSWRVWSAERHLFSGNTAALYGERFANVLSAKPDSVFVADGSEVSVSHGVRLRL
ncbi:MAG: DUF2071 domain-containing protein [Candidatus Hydrogenedentota bacterium]